jgi:hypothetical protein
MGEILIAGPGARGGWRPTYEPSSECDFSAEPGRPVLGYRLWQIRTPEDGLRGIHPFCPAQWRDRTKVAGCLSRPIAGRANSPELAVVHDTAPPARECTCGISAFYDPLHGERGVSGVVAIEGRTILHDIWLRAETARIECLALGHRVRPEERALIERLSSEWEIPIVGADELGEFARGRGTEVPRILRPARREPR